LDLGIVDTLIGAVRHLVDEGVAFTQAPRISQRRRKPNRPSLPQAESGTSIGMCGAPWAGSYGRSASSGWSGAS